MTMMWVGIGSTVVGAGVSLYGANKASKDARAANAANVAAQDRATQLNYQQWLMSRGVAPDGTAVNTKLPMWAYARRGGTPGMTPRLVRKGTAAMPRITGTSSFVPPSVSSFAT